MTIMEPPVCAECGKHPHHHAATCSESIEQICARLVRKQRELKKSLPVDRYRVPGFRTRGYNR